MTVYFPNWHIRSDVSAQVRLLPWDRLKGINHAFWKVAPVAGGFALAPIDPWADVDLDNPLAHFPQYAECAKQHSAVRILLSVGGWSACGYFSAMALTAAGRASFIRSCLETLDAAGLQALLAQTGTPDQEARGRLITDHAWYFVCPAPTDLVLRPGQNCRLRFSEQITPLRARLVRQNGAVLAFRLTEGGDCLSLRRCEAELMEDIGFL